MRRRRFFEALFAALDTARSLICLEYYIIRADRTGGRLAELLVRARERGVAVFCCMMRWVATRQLSPTLAC